MEASASPFGFQNLMSWVQVLQGMVFAQSLFAWRDSPVEQWEEFQHADAALAGALSHSSMPPPSCAAAGLHQAGCGPARMQTDQ